MRKKLLIGFVFLMAGSRPAHGTTVTFGADTQADLSVLASVTPAFSAVLFCNPFIGSCSTTELTWSSSRISDDGSGNVKILTDGTMDNEGWMFGDQYIQISGVKGNDPGWVLDIYTENLVGHPYKYIGPFASAGPVNGLVSSSGEFLLPLSWKLTNQAIANFKTNPMPEEVPAGGKCGTAVRATAGFCDYATHFMADKGDTNLNPPHQSTWWQNLTPGTTTEAADETYQSILTNDGAATLEGYHLPYSTLTGIGTYYLYIGTEFAKGSIRDNYQTTVFLDIVNK